MFFRLAKLRIFGIIRGSCASRTPHLYIFLLLGDCSVDVSKLLEKAKDVADKRNYDIAIDLYLQALKLSPDNATAVRDLRAVEIRLAKEKGASIFTKGKNAGLYAKAASLATMKKYDAALETCEEIFKTDPGYVSGLILSGDAALEAGYRQRAIATLEDIKTMGAGGNTKQLTAVLRKLANAYEAEEKINEAMEIWQIVIKNNPGDRDATLKIRDLSAKTMTAKISTATAGGQRGSVARQAQTDEQRKVTDRLQRETSDIKTGDDLKAAIDDKLSDLQKRPDDPKLFESLGELYKRAGNYNESKKAYETARQKDANNPTYLFKLHDLEIWKMMNSLRVLQPKVQSKDPAATEQYNKERMALMEYRLKSFTERERAYSTDSSIRFHLGQIYQDLADAKKEKGFYDEAIKRFQATFQDPKFKVESGLRMGQCFTAKSQYDLAIKRFDETLKSLPELKDDRWKNLKYWLGDTLQKAGRADEAKKIFLEVYEIDVSFRDISKRVDELG